MTGPLGRKALAVGLRGEGPAAGAGGEAPVILLHAFPLDSRMWEPVMAELAFRGVVAHALDFPGIGVTPIWDGVEPSLDAIADAAVETLLGGIGAKAAHWVGCSMGGYVALAIAERHPEVVEGLGLFNTRSTADDEAAGGARLVAAAEAESAPGLADPRARAEALVGLEGSGREGVVARATDIIAGVSGAAIAWGLRAMASRPDRTSVLRAFSGRVVVLAGELDRVTTAEDAAHMAAACRVGVTTIPGAGHLSPLEAPLAVASAVEGLARPQG